jgi:serine/threonine protein kinase HipA of HipAB toxin-antitoxin module
MGGYVARMGRGEERRIQRKPEGNRPIGRPGVDGRKILRSSESGMWRYGVDRAGSG